MLADILGLIFPVSHVEFKPTYLFLDLRGKRTSAINLHVISPHIRRLKDVPLPSADAETLKSNSVCLHYKIYKFFFSYNLIYVAVRVDY